MNWKGAQMPEVEITIGGRSFEVACQEGEQHFLQSAAKMLDDEARVLTSQIGRIPEARMLLMAGLMLADKSAGMEDRMRELEAKVAEQNNLIDELRNAPAPAPERVEVPVVPSLVTDALAEMVARAESIAEDVEEKAAR
jgi:cell division protein ZapA